MPGPSKPSSDISDQPLDFQPKPTFGPDQLKQFSYSHVDRPANDGIMDQNIVTTSVRAWTSTTTPAVTFPPIPLAPSGVQFDPLFASQPSLSVYTSPDFGGISIPNFQAPISSASTPFGLGAGTSLHATNFLGDAAVPNWLREEIIKKKSAIASTNSLHSGVVETEDADMSFRKTDQTDNQSLDSRRSIEDEDDDEVHPFSLSLFGHSIFTNLFNLCSLIASSTVFSWQNCFFVQSLSWNEGSEVPMGESFVVPMEISPSETFEQAQIGVLQHGLDDIHECSGVSITDADSHLIFLHGYLQFYRDNGDVVWMKSVSLWRRDSRVFSLSDDLKDCKLHGLVGVQVKHYVRCCKFEALKAKQQEFKANYHHDLLENDDKGNQCGGIDLPYTFDKDRCKCQVEVSRIVTDELFDEIATKVLDEDEPNAEVVESIILDKPRVSPPPSVPIPKESSKSLVPQRTDSKEIDANEIFRPSTASGDLLGLGNYDSDASNSDNDDENGRIPSRKLDSTSHRPETNAMSYEHSLKNMRTAMELPNADSNGDVKKEKNVFLPDSRERKRDVHVHAKSLGASETSLKTSSINFESAGESRGDDVRGLKSNEAAGNERVKRPEISNRDRTITEACGDCEANILSSSDQILERSLNTRVPIKEVAGGSHRNDNESNKHREKQKEKIDKGGRLNERFGDRNVKQGTNDRETHSKSNSRSDIIKDSKKEISKDKSEKQKGYVRISDRERNQTEDYKRDEKEDRSKFARETFRHKIRSKSPISIGRHVKDNSAGSRASASSEDSFDNPRKRYAKVKFGHTYIH
ncbi:hypothetical protein KSP40_PGU014137 [Platanthera guangdongensis]|uniref:Uncharacterized protein n=1 Tax=Platanthera guangdongensis TaxID=2320717 RepID=A0ABR2N301_9ASPA